MGLRRQNNKFSFMHPVASGFGIRPSKSDWTVVDLVNGGAVGSVSWDHIIGQGVSGCCTPGDSQFGVGDTSIIHPSLVPV